MFRAFAILVRCSYLLTVLTVLAVALYCTLELAPKLVSSESYGRAFGADLFTLAVLVTFLLLPLRALTRVFVRDALVPESHLRERPVVATLVTITGLLGCGLFVLIVRILIGALPTERDLNFGGPLILTLLLMAIATLIGEIVLVGRQGAAPD